MNQSGYLLGPAILDNLAAADNKIGNLSSLPSSIRSTTVVGVLSALNNTKMPEYARVSTSAHPDFNNLYSGFTLMDASTASNGPTNSGKFMVLNIMDDEGEYRAQLAMSVEADAIYFRRYTDASEVWSAWKQLQFVAT